MNCTFEKRFTRIDNTFKTVLSDSACKQNHLYLEVHVDTINFPSFLSCKSHSVYVNTSFDMVYLKSFICFVYLFEVICLTLDFFTHSETSPVPVKGCKFWHMLGTYGHWAVSVLLWHGASVYNGHLQGPVTLTPNAERLPVELWVPV